jgi:hypothetical protein
LILALAAIVAPAALAAPLFPNPTDEIGSVGFVALGDFNGDGKGDAVLINGSQNLEFLKGLGDGTFAPPVPVAAVTGARRMSTADFDRDGRLDVAVLVYDYVSGHGTNIRVLVFRGHGDGSFDPPVPYFVANDAPTAMATVDFNGDGAPDAVVLTATLLCRLFNSGTGTLNAPVCQSWTGANLGYNLAVGDFNSDGLPDLAVHESVTTSAGGVAVQVLFNNGPTGFSEPVTLVPNSFSGEITVADLNGDGHDDIVFTVYAELSDPTSWIRILFGDGAGGFSAPVSYAGQSCCDFLAVVDVDNDGLLDIVSGGNGGFTVLPGLPGGVWGPMRLLGGGEVYRWAALGDLNGDGRIDLVSSMGSTVNSDALRSLLGTPDGRFGMTSLGQGASTDVASADLNGDGKPDLVVVENSANRLSVLLSRGDGTFEAPVPYPCGTAPQGLVLGDFNNDGHIDAVTGLNGSLALLLGHGDGTLAAPLTIPGGDRHTQVVAGDFNRDGWLDLATNNSLDLDVSVFWNYIDVWGMGRYAAGTFPSAIATADVDGDGILDLVTGSRPDRNFMLALGVLHGRGDGTFIAPQSFLTWQGPGTSCKVSDVVIADFNGDGIPDLAAPTFLQGGAGDVSVFLGLGQGAFGPRLSLTGGSTPIALAAADLNGDGRIDLVAAYADSADVGIFEADGAGGFLPPQRFGTVTPADLVLGDFNGDGLTDFGLATPEAVASVVLDHGLPGNGGHDPVANAGPDRSAECPGVVLDGSASTDADSAPGTNNDIVGFQWFENYGLPSQTALGAGRSLSLSLPVGAHAITLRVTDSTGRSATDGLLLTVVDTLPPTGTVALSPGTLWPPNHRMETVNAQVTASDQCGGPVTITLDSVASSEPDDAPGNADGSTTQDIQFASLGTPDFSIVLRAERASTGPGRTYTVTYRLTDNLGNASLVSGTAAVPHDLSGVTDPVNLQVNTTQNPDTLQWAIILNWNAIAGVSRYDVATGPLAALVHMDPFAGGSPPACLADRIPNNTTSFLIPDIPVSPGNAIFFVVDYVTSAAPTSGPSGYGSESGPYDIQPVVPVGLCP